jgi:hypothetical protein
MTSMHYRNTVFNSLIPEIFQTNSLNTSKLVARSGTRPPEDHALNKTQTFMFESAASPRFQT